MTRPDPRAGRRLESVPAAAAVARPPRVAPAAPGPGPVVRAWPLLRAPVLLTLAVTLLRLSGERLHWSPYWFSRLAGGGLSPIGIVWLVPLVGGWLGFRLQRLGLRPPGLLRPLAVPLAALALAPVVPWAVNRVHPTTWTANLVVWAITCVAVTVLAATAWPALGRLLVVYALAARLPVAAVMAAAMALRWGTHYDAVPPGFPGMPIASRWLLLGLLPQATIWTALTVGVGAASGVLGWLLAARRPR